MPMVTFEHFETVVLNGGKGNNTFDVYGTQREQGNNGGHSSTFTINTGGGGNAVNIGTPQTVGDSLDSLDSFLINTSTSGGGVPVMVNGQGGNDTVQFLDTADTTATNLAFVTQQFSDILPNAEQLTSATEASQTEGPNYSPPAQTYLAQFSQIFGAAADATPYNTVALSEQAAVTVSAPTTSAGHEQFTVTDENNTDPSADPTGGTFALTIAGVPNQAPFVVQGIPYNASTQVLQMLIQDATAVPGANNTMTQEVTAAVTKASASVNSWTIDFTNPSSGLTLSADASGLATSPAALNVHARGVQTIAASLGSGNNVVQLTGPTAYNILVNGDQSASTGTLNFNVSPSFDNSSASTTGVTAAGSATVSGLAATTGLAVGMSVACPDLTGGPYTITGIDAATSSITLNTGAGVEADSNATLDFFYSAVLNGGDGANTLFANYANGVPHALASLTFNGGTSGNNTLRIQGDGVASGAYTPSATLNDAGFVNVNSDLFTFGSTQTLIVHGLKQLADITPSGTAADLNVNSQTVASLNLPNLILHQVTVQGVVTWTQQQTSTPPAAPQALHLGKVSALDAAGTILVVGADLKDPSSASTTLDSYGPVFVYTWDSTTSSWVQQAQLEPGDLAGGGGGGFGDAVAISPDGSAIVVGAPGDVAGGANAGAVYVFQLVGGFWVESAKLKATDMAAGAAFGSSVSLDGNSVDGYTLFVGAPSANNEGAAYVFTSASGSTWTQQQELNAPAAAPGAQFGAAVAESDGFAVVGAPGSGAAYVYNFNSLLWTQAATLTSSNAADGKGDDFGAAVAIEASFTLTTDDILVVVGAPHGNAPLPAAYQTAQLNTEANTEAAGEAFVFNYRGLNSAPVEALLTETDGLPEADAATVDQQGGDQFGAAVAIAGDDGSGEDVVVGAPGYNRGSGAAYAFYRLPDQGSGNGPSWTRSSGASGSGQLTPAAPQAADPGAGAPLAGEFGSSVVVGGVSASGGRVVIGMQGYNQTNSSNIITAANAGAIRTYTTNGTLPSNADPNLDAEILEGPHGQKTFGQDTVYDASTRMLFVAAPPAAGTAGVDVYLNEGLYWQFVQTLTAPTADSGFAQFGFALAASGNTLVIGAPSSNQSDNGLVLIYTITDNTLSQPQIVTGANYDFGYSVAVSGGNLVVGSPQETVSYTFAPGGETTPSLAMTNVGAAYVYTQSGATWGLSLRMAAMRLPTKC